MQEWQEAMQRRPQGGGEQRAMEDMMVMMGLGGELVFPQMFRRDGDTVREVLNVVGCS